MWVSPSSLSRASKRLGARLDVSISVNTWRAPVAAAFAAGAVRGNDMKASPIPATSPTAAAAGVTVVVTHIRLAHRFPAPTGVRRRGEGAAFLHGA